MGGRPLPLLATMQRPASPPLIVAGLACGDGLANS